MGHFIQAIIAPAAHAGAVSKAWPELPRLNHADGFTLFPVTAKLIDARIAPTTTPTQTDDEFMLLTDGLRRLLQSMSSGGLLAYIETEYFGGVGGQGALVCQDGVEVMPPTWRSQGAINEAFERIDVPRPLVGDWFDALGLGDFRDNEELLDRIATSNSPSA